MINLNANNKYTLDLLLSEYKKIQIPKIQRDYAFGRKDEETTEKRKNFIEALVNALGFQKHLHLDFIYGTLQDNVLTLLDGQQRITTLWLLELVLIKNGLIEPKGSQEKNFNKFTYETRTSSREFCKKLVQEDWNFNNVEINEDNYVKKIEKHIYGAKWFFNAWKFDPTIKGMIVVISEIFYQLKRSKNESYNIDNITFSFLEISKMGKPDDLYIKMNSRGKELSEWDIFKSNLFKSIKKTYRDKFKDYILWFEKDLADFFWENKKEKDGSEEVEVSMILLMKKIMYLRVIESTDKLNEIEKNISKITHDKIVRYIDKNYIDILDEGVIDSIITFVDFLIKEKETHDIENIEFTRFGQKGLRIDEVYADLSNHKEITYGNLPLIYVYYKFSNKYTEDENGNIEELKQIIRVTSNLTETYRNQANILYKFIQGLKNAIEHKEGILKYLIDDSNQDIDFGNHSFEQTLEERDKAKILLDYDNEINELIYKIEGNQYLDGNLNIILKLHLEYKLNLKDVYIQIKEKFNNIGNTVRRYEKNTNLEKKEAEEDIIVNKSQVLEMIEYIELKDMLMQDRNIPRNPVSGEHDTNKPRDSAWRRFFMKIAYGKNSQLKGLLGKFYNYLINESTNKRNPNEYTLPEKWYLYNKELIYEIGSIREEEGRVFGLKWDKSYFSARKFDVPLLLASLYSNEVKYNGFSAMKDDDAAIYKEYEIKYMYSKEDLDTVKLMFKSSLGEKIKEFKINDFKEEFLNYINNSL